LTVTKSGKATGVLAKVVPLRFENGARQGIHGKKRFMMPPMVFQGRELLYLAMFFLPRFQNQSLEEKIRTVCHELYHINPQFNGDIRRFPGANYAHGRSRKWYDTLFEDSVQRVLKWLPASPEFDWLKLSFDELYGQHGALAGHRFAMPKLIPLEGAGSAQLILVQSRPQKKRRRILGR
jgi:hypothetical protein